MSGERHALADERSLELHREVAEKLRADTRLLELARERVRGWLRDESPAHSNARAWHEILSRPADEVAAFLTDPGERAQALRQSSPFAGAIDARTRWKAWRRVNQRLRAS
jgi:hypothetical protein